jgi:hypothetical protein
MSLRLHQFGLLATQISIVLAQQFGTFPYTTVFGTDARLSQKLLHLGDVFLLVFLDISMYRLSIGHITSPPPCYCEC